MKIDVKEIANGSYNGKKVFICDYRVPDLDKKPIRSVEPTEVLVRDNDETKKRIYYSNSHFVSLKKNGEPSSKVIGLYDNTGFRSYTGEPVKVFDNLAECEAQWNDDLKFVQDRWIERRRTALQDIDNQIHKIDEMRK